jgi:hypothetical protein
MPSQREEFASSTLSPHHPPSRDAAQQDGNDGDDDFLYALHPHCRDGPFPRMCAQPIKVTIYYIRDTCRAIASLNAVVLIHFHEIFNRSCSDSFPAPPARY